MATGAAAGRERYRWLLLLVAAVMLVAWLVTGGGQEPEPGGSTATDPSSPSSSPSPSFSPSHDFTETNTPSTEPEVGLPSVRLADLPPEAARIVDLIDRGGPFDEDEDGGTFRNDEEILPDQPRGYYREYTVPTPGSDGRGARRIVAGEGGELYWTGDHYNSFSRIAR